MIKLSKGKTVFPFPNSYVLYIHFLPIERTGAVVQQHFILKVTLITNQFETLYYYEFDDTNFTLWHNLCLVVKFFVCFLALEVTVAAEDVQLKDLVQHLITLEQEKQQMQAQIDAQSKTISKLNQSLTSLSSVARKEPNVFFTAVCFAKSGYVEESDAVIFDFVLSNEGSSYDENTGTFVSPVAGFYQFEFHIYSDKYDAWLELRHNNDMVVEIRCYGSDGQRGSSNSAIIQLAPGDKVNIIAHHTSFIMSDSHHYTFSTFSGRLIALVW